MHAASFRDAVRVLATEPGPICSRLVAAYVAHLTRVKPEDLPPAVARRFALIHKRLKQTAPVATIGAFGRYMRHGPMSEVEASAHAKVIVEIADALGSG